MRFWVLIAMLLLAACNAAPVPGGGEVAGADNVTTTQQPAVAAATAIPLRCPDWDPAREGMTPGELEEILPPKPLVIPAAFADMASATRSVMAVRTLSGDVHCIRLAWIGAAEQYWLSADRRFFGFHHIGYENFGYRMVDRAGKGAEFDTGVKPLFAPSGKRFASAQTSEAGFGELEGIGLWEVKADRVHRAAFFDVATLHPGVDWRVDRWANDDLVCLSMVAQADSETLDGTDYEAAVARLPRQRYALSQWDGRWALKPVQPNTGCAG